MPCQAEENIEFVLQLLQGHNLLKLKRQSQMKQTFLVLTFLLTYTGFTHGQKREEKLVRKSFDSYKSAILNGEGKKAVQYVDSRTIQYYSHLLDLVKTADSVKVESLSILDKLMVFSIRHRTPREEVLSFDGTGLFVYAINSGMVGKNSVANNTIGDVSLDHDFAKGQLVVLGDKAPFYFHFYKEAKQWKLDLTSLFSVSTTAFKKMADESGQNENDFLFLLLEKLTGNKPTRQIWEPVNQVPR
jgi:hypothetical protein